MGTPKFNWIGKPIIAPPIRRRTGLPHYNSFNLGALTAVVGDFVLIKNDANKDDILSCDVARIESLYEDSSSTKDPYRGLVTWLCRPSLLPRQCKMHEFEEQGAPPLDDRCDVVMEARSYCRDISLETVYFKCNVHSQPITTDPETYIKSCKTSQYPNYILRFKMVPSLRKRNMYLLESYQDENPSPLKLSSTSPLKQTSNSSKSPLKEQVNRNRSPEVEPVPKLKIPDEFCHLLGKSLQVNVNNFNPLTEETKKITDNKKRRLSSRNSSRENTPRKKSKQSTSVTVSPELDDIVMETPPRYVLKTPTSNRRQSASKGSVAIAKMETKTPKQSASDRTSSVRTPKQSSCVKPKQLIDDLESVSTKKSARLKLQPNGDGKNNTSQSPFTEKNDMLVADRFTEIVTATGSGRKVKISCGQKNRAKAAPKSGLDDDAILSLLDDEFEPESKPELKQQHKKLSLKVKKNSAKVPEPKKRTRRASISVVEKKPIKISIKKNVTMSETKKGSRKRVEQSESSSSESELEEEEESSDSDFEDSPEVTIKRKKKPASVATPRAKPARTGATNAATATPGVARRVKPVAKCLNPLAEAQARLHVSAVPESLPCREDEFAEILTYVEGKLQDGAGGCIYISGVPGTGKTATVKQVMRYMEENRDEFPDFNFYELNGMRMTCPEQTYTEMWKQLTGEKLVHEQAMKKLDQRFSSSAPRGAHTVFLVDELDMLCKKKQTLLYNMFQWPSRPQGKLIIIAIANTMDLPERDMDMRVLSRLGFNRLHFDPYTHQQLQCIVTSRLEGLEVFQSDEVQLVSKKVAGLSGDARRALDICRILVERAEREGKEKVTQLDVLKVHKEMFTTPKMMYIRCCSKMEQYFLRAMVCDFHKTGLEESLMRNIYRRMGEVCATEGIQQPSFQAIFNISVRLSSQRLILSEHYRKGLDTKLRLNVGFDDINFALMKQPSSG